VSKSKPGQEQNKAHDGKTALMALAANPTERLNAMLLKLGNGERLNISQFANEFGTSSRAAQCDLDRLAFLELKESGGCYSLDPAFKRKHATSLGDYARLSTLLRGGSGRPPVDASAFEVVVIGTMSAGKSTFLNALIGQELLPVTNEAATARMTRIVYDPKKPAFEGMRLLSDGRRLEQRKQMKPEIVAQWNGATDTRHIELRGAFDTSVPLTLGLSLYDTPGPNNSQKVEHRQVMLEALRQSDFHGLFYVLNAEHLATDDDCRTLENLLEVLAGKQVEKMHGWKRPCFILNKIDSLDPEKGENETIWGFVGKAAEYLVKTGFSDPVIVPMSSRAAFCAKLKLRGHRLSRTQESYLGTIAHHMHGHRLMKAARIPEPIRELWREHLEDPATEGKPVDHLLSASGIVAAEALLQARYYPRSHSAAKRKC
jgi:ribosome biogenesis GTPase A